MIINRSRLPPGLQIAFVDTETGDYGEQKVQHREEAERFYRDLAGQGKKVRVGMEASGHARWFERLLAELKFELWIGDAAEIQTKRARNQKTDRVRIKACRAKGLLIRTEIAHLQGGRVSRHRELSEGKPRWDCRVSPGAGVRIGSSERARITTDRMNNKITGQRT